MKPFFLALCAALCPVMLTASTVVYYHFEGPNGQVATNIVDSSTNGLNGSVQGSAVYATGPAGSCLDLTGDYNYVSIPGTESLVLSNSWTVEMLFRMNVPYVNDGSDPAVLFSKLDTADAGVYLDSFTVQLGSSGYFGSQIGFAGLNGQYVGSSEGNFSDGNWHHVALVYNADSGTGTNTLLLYGDYALVGSVTAAFPAINWVNYPVNIGAGNYPGNDPNSGFRRNMDGQVDEFRISDAALTPDQFVSVATGRPAPLTIEGVVGGVSLSWGSITNETYQLKAVTDLGTDPWVNFGGPVVGTGGKISVPDNYVSGQGQRFYELFMTP